jgi:hypothetical protein
MTNRIGAFLHDQGLVTRYQVTRGKGLGQVLCELRGLELH